MPFYYRQLARALICFVILKKEELFLKTMSGGYVLKSHSMEETHPGSMPLIRLYDRYLLFAAIALVGIGLLMVASSSIVISQKAFNEPFHFLFRQLLYLILGTG